MHWAHSDRPVEEIFIDPLSKLHDCLEIQEDAFIQAD